MLRVLACSRPFVDGCMYADVDVWVGWIRRFGQKGGGGGDRDGRVGCEGEGIQRRKRLST